ncbi:DUF1707 domain-containing protein [Streptomyces malaysiensis subsp. malaysiensis]|uniref:DUF1707 SHOCT-like domain-containing protein n=1 Tax=Streptomyces malaysiensis TaxID=92644 RepID=UPI0024BF29D2|nr:DUF1707 domain-containing protein [Streptomyces sp. NA07423]WHX20685.1 DUF1707 domain-containing protein [Streptomyces sp. NA07423]
MTSAGSSQGSDPDLPDPAGMRASDAERERIAEVLREAVAEGRLDMEEFEERLGAAYAARTHGQLEPLVRDLPVPGSAVPAPPSPGDHTGWRERIGGPPTSKWAVAIMGGFQRKGTWTVPRAFTAFALMGGGEIDLREARFEDRDVVIRCFALMSGVQIIVPPDLETHVGGIGLMGGFDHTGSADGDPAGPRVTVTGLALFGGVGVERKLRKEEHKRLKEERRQVKAERREQLRAERRELRDERRERRDERRLSLEKDRRRDDY